VAALEEEGEIVLAEDVGIFLEKFDREISSQVVFRGILFDGKETSLSFPSRIDPDKKAPLNRGVGRVSYLFDESSGAIARRQENLNQIYKKEEIEAVSVLKNVTEVQFQYFVYRKAEKIFEWVKTWSSLENEGAIPFEVKVEFGCTEGEEKHVFERTFTIPTAENAR
jgi:hypothetical protein